MIRCRGYIGFPSLAPRIYPYSLFLKGLRLSNSTSCNGTFVNEGFVAGNSLGPTGTVIDLAFSSDSRQELLYIISGDEHIRILNRDTLQVIGQFGRLGHFPGQLYHLHAFAVDSKGNIYAGENTGKRVQKFLFRGFSSTSNE